MCYPVCLRCGGEEMLCVVRRECLDFAWLESNGQISFRSHDETDYDILEMQCRTCKEVLKDEQGSPIKSSEGLVAFYRRNQAKFTKVSGSNVVATTIPKEIVMSIKESAKDPSVSLKDKEESRRVAKLIRAKAKQCYYNAFRLVQEVNSYAQADYVEGFAIDEQGYFIEHGWVGKEGIVIDPTLPLDELRYVPGIRFRGQPGIAEAMRIPKPDYKEEDLPFFYRFGWAGSDNPDFAKARADAEAIVLGKSRPDSI